MECAEKKIQTLVASDQFLSRLGIKTLLSVIGVVSDLQEASSLDELKTALGSGKKPDYLILTEKILAHPKNKCLEDLRKNCWKCKTMLICEQLIPGCACEQFILDSYDQKVVLEKFQDFFFEPELSAYEEDSLVLSDREIEVLKAVALGFSNKEIADQLCISINTVITHRKNITSKLGIKTISGLTVYALLNHLIHAEEVM